MWMRKKVVEKSERKRVTVQGPTSSPKNHASPDFLALSPHTHLSALSSLPTRTQAHKQDRLASVKERVCVSLVGGFSIQCLERKIRDATPTL